MRLAPLPAHTGLTRWRKENLPCDGLWQDLERYAPGHLGISGSVGLARVGRGRDGVEESPGNLPSCNARREGAELVFGFGNTSRTEPSRDTHRGRSAVSTPGRASSYGAPVPDDPRKSLVPSASVMSRPFARFVPSLA